MQAKRWIQSFPRPLWRDNIGSLMLRHHEYVNTYLQCITWSCLCVVSSGRKADKWQWQLTAPLTAGDNSIPAVPFRNANRNSSHRHLSGAKFADFATTPAKYKPWSQCRIRKHFPLVTDYWNRLFSKIRYYGRSSFLVQHTFSLVLLLLG